jgi:L-cystine transport system substrate-binding protein
MKKLTALLFALVFLFSLTACGLGEEEGVQTILIGTSNDYPPYCYLDANGDLTGFEKTLLDAVDAKLPQYKFKYEVLDFKTILTSLDAGRIDLAAHQYGWNEEREEKYIFGTVSYFQSDDYIVVQEGRTDIATLDDLSGKIVSVAPASNWAALLENWNAAHPGQTQISIKYYESTPQILAADLKNGVIDATLLTQADLLLFNAMLGTKFQKVGDPLSNTATYHIYSKDQTELRDAVDGVLAELKASGELERLSQAALDSVLKTNR